MDGALTKNESGTHAVQAYMSIWHNTGDSHPGGTSLKKQDVGGSPLAVQMSMLYFDLENLGSD